MGTSHLILGETSDYITGQTITDTHDERARQKIARLLIDDKGYSKTDIQTRRKLTLTIDGKTGSVTIDFIVHVDKKPFMLIMFGPGSLVTRQRPTIAAARLIENNMVPFSIITNGRDADIMDTVSGNVIDHGLNQIPSRKEASKKLNSIKYSSLPENRREKEQRILYTMNVLTEKECDDFTCGLS
jgi:hypothetical protein